MDERKDFIGQGIDVAAPDECLIGRENRQAEHAPATGLRLLSEPLAVGKEGLEYGQGKLRAHLFIDVVELRLFAPVYHVPYQVNPLDVRLARDDHLFVDDSGELDGAFHHHAVGDDGREDIVHPRQGAHYLGIVDGAGQVEEDDVRHLPASAEALCGGDGVLGTAADDGIVFLAQLSEQVIRLYLVIVVLHDGVHVAFAHVMDAVLGEVAVDDGDVISLYVMQVARHEHRERRLACSAFLGGESNIQWFVFLFVHCLLGFMGDTYIDTFICRFVGCNQPMAIGA